MNKVPRRGFRYVGNKTFGFSSKKKDFLPKNDRILSEIGIFVHCRLIWCPVDGLAGGCGARAVSRKTPIYFMVYLTYSVHPTELYHILHFFSQQQQLILQSLPKEFATKYSKRREGG